MTCLRRCSRCISSIILTRQLQSIWRLAIISGITQGCINTCCCGLEHDSSPAMRDYKTSMLTQGFLCGKIRNRTTKENIFSPAGCTTAKQRNKNSKVCRIKLLPASHLAKIWSNTIWLCLETEKGHFRWREVSISNVLCCQTWQNNVFVANFWQDV